MSESDTSPDGEPEHDKTQSKLRSPNLNDSEIGKDSQKEIIWLPPESDEEWVLFGKLLDEIRLMYDFARERGIEPPLAAIEGIPKLLTFSKPEASENSTLQRVDQSTKSEPKQTK